MCVKKLSRRLNNLPSWMIPIVLTFGFAILLYLAYLTYPVMNREYFVVGANGEQVRVYKITLGMKAAYPDALTMHVGEYVQFEGEDKTVHDIGLGGGDEDGKEHEHTDAEFESGAFGGGEAYRVQVKKAGVYHFHDHKNAALFATVIAY